MTGGNLQWNDLCLNQEPNIFESMMKVREYDDGKKLTSTIPPS